MKTRAAVVLLILALIGGAAAVAPHWIKVAYIPNSLIRAIGVGNESSYSLVAIKRVSWLPGAELNQRAISEEAFQRYAAEGLPAQSHRVYPVSRLLENQLRQLDAVRKVPDASR